MASRKGSKVASLACKYQLRRGKKPDVEGSVGVEKSIKEEPSEFISVKQEPVDEFKVETTKESRSKKRKSVQVKVEDEDIKTSPKVAKTVGKIEDASSDGWFPPNWEKVLDNIRTMRKEVAAPVDSMGCDMCHDKTTSPKIQRYQILVSLMLSSQTKDQVTFAAMGRLREHGLTPENMVATSDDVLRNLLHPVGFYKRKTEYIKRASQILLDKYEGDIPDSIEKLCELPGVGPKMAHICMNSSWNIVSGIGVDTHVHRISQRLGWIPPEKLAENKKTRSPGKEVRKEKKDYQRLTPEDVRVALESWLPKNLWSEVNHLLVGFGQTICKPTGPSCKSCLNFSICPSAKLKW
uniref:Endonuclease III homolog n=1 Tax=Lygus hesperus TaxID=30085 RepID=A0A0A9WGF8_LYGHE